MYRKTISVMLAVCMVVLMMAPASPVLAEEGTSSSSPVWSLAQAEKMLYGQEQSGGLVQRIEKLEQDLFGEVKTGALFVRIESVNAFIASNEFSGASLTTKLNAVEWVIYEKVSEGLSVTNRLEALEAALYGTTQSGPIVGRVDNLVKLVWPTGRVNIKQVDVPKETLIKIRMLSELNSAKNRVGDKVRYRIVEDVKIGDYLIIPKGTESEGRVTEVVTAGNLGKDGRVMVDFGEVRAMDGTMVKLQIAEKATEKNKSLELAAGASMAGVLLLGPIGLVGGYFVKGKDVVIPAGTEFYVEVKSQTKVSGLGI